MTEHTQHMALLSLAIKIFFTFFWLSKALNMCAQSLQSCLTLCHLWTVVHRASLFMGFSRQEDWSGLPSLPTGDFPNQESNPCLWHLLNCRQVLYPLSHLGSPKSATGKPNTLAMQEMQSLSQEEPLKNRIYSSILAWRIPWTDEPGGLSP